MIDVMSRLGEVKVKTAEALRASEADVRASVVLVAVVREFDSKADKANRGVDDNKGPQFGPAVTLSGAFANVQPTDQAEKTQPYKPGSISSISA